MDWYEKFEKIREFLSDEIIIEAMQNYFNSDELNDFCDSMITDYDLESEFEDDEDE